MPEITRIDYAGSVHGEDEINAVVEVLRGPPTALRIGRNVREMERRVASLFGKERGVMVNSGSSALYLAVELLDLDLGDEIITSAVTFGTDIAPMVRAGLTPVYVDVTADTFQIDTDQVEAAVGPRTRAILVPDLIGNCPDWDVLRSVADRHGLLLVEDSCDCLGATLRGTPTGARADISVTSFALSHIITAAGTGGMLCVDRDDWLDRALLLRRWGRRSEPTLWGTEKGQGRGFFSALPDGAPYDDLFIFDELGWNFEPSELSAAFGVVQLQKLDTNLERRRRNAALLDEGLARHRAAITSPRLTDEVDTAWHMYPILLADDVPRAAFQEHMQQRGVDTRMVWSGNITRQPAFADRPHRVAPGGLEHADRVTDRGLVLPCNHAIDDDGCAYIIDCVDAFFAGPRP